MSGYLFIIMIPMFNLRLVDLSGMEDGKYMLNFVYCYYKTIDF